MKIIKCQEDNVEGAIVNSKDKRMNDILHAMMRPVIFFNVFMNQMHCVDVRKIGVV